jgi:hypothetical protein
MPIRLINGKMRLLVSPWTGSRRYLPLLVPWQMKEGTLYICEGVWDGMALCEVLGMARLAGKSAGENKGIKLVATGKVEESLRASAAVIAVPSAAVFFDTWAPVAAGRRGGTTVSLRLSDYSRTQRYEESRRDTGPGEVQTFSPAVPSLGR